MRELRLKSGVTIAVIADAEANGLLAVGADGHEMGLTEAGEEWCRAYGLRTHGFSSFAESEVTGFLAFYSREIGLPLVADSVYEALDIAEKRISEGK